MKNNIKMIAVLVVLIVIYFITQRKETTIDIDTQFLKLDSASISRIELKSPEKGHSLLEKKNDVWMIGKYNAEWESVKHALFVFKDIKINRVVSRKSERHEPLKVTEETGLVVKVTSGDNISEFIVGKDGATFDNSMIRMVGEDIVYATEGNFRAGIELSATEWRDRTVLNINKDNIASLKVERKGKETLYVFNKDTAVLLSQGSTENIVGNWEVNEMVSDMEPLNGDELPKREDFDFSNPDLKVTVTKRDGDIASFIAIKNPDEKERYVAKAQGIKYARQFYANSLEKFFKDINDLKK